MKQIIAIGGGGFGSSTPNNKMDQYLIQQTRQKHPKVCFLPQASAEDKTYIVKFFEACTKVEAMPSWVSLFGRVENKWRDHLLAQDLIYVGGGNTRSMLALWREWEMGKILKEAYQNGTVLAGVSAGAICWFEACITDSVWPLGSLNGLGLLEGSCCPHYDSELERRPTFLDKVKKGEVISGIALEDNTAAHFVDGELKCVVASNLNKKAYYVSQEGEEALPVIYLDEF